LLIVCTEYAFYFKISYAFILTNLQDAMMTMKNRPRLEDDTEKTEVQIIEEVLKEKSPKNSSTGTFLSNLGIGSISRKSSVSTARIRELENKLSEQEEQSLLAAERYKKRDGGKDGSPGSKICRNEKEARRGLCSSDESTGREKHSN
jgi:hypothetical protein